MNDVQRRRTRHLVAMAAVFVIACGRKEGESASSTEPSPLGASSDVASANTTPSPSAAPSASTSGSTAAAAPVLWLVANDPTAGAKQPGAVKIGCDDWLVPKPLTLTAADTKGRLVEAMVKLLAEMKAKLSVASVKDGADGALLLDLKGTLTFGGMCDPPRLIQPVERTAAQFGRVTISVNGQAKTWRCANDESGKCQ